MLNYNGRYGDTRVGSLQSLEDMGAATFYEDESIDRMREAFPDSGGFDDVAAVASLPEYVRNYRCGDAIESGDPFCASDKFTKWGCANRMKQSKWHPGL